MVTEEQQSGDAVDCWKSIEAAAQTEAADAPGAGRWLRVTVVVRPPERACEEDQGKRQDDAEHENPDCICRTQPGSTCLPRPCHCSEQHEGDEIAGVRQQIP